MFTNTLRDFAAATQKNKAMMELEMMKTERSLAEVGSSTSPKVNISEGDSLSPQEPLGVTF